MSPPTIRQQQEFTVPSQLSKSKLSLKGQKIIKKENLRSKANAPKIIIDSQHEDIQEKQELLAKRNAKKWWKKFNKKYFSIFNSIEDAQIIINKTQQLPIGGEKLGTYFEEEIFNEDAQSMQTIQRKDTIRVLFRRQLSLDSKEYYNLISYELGPSEKLQNFQEEHENRPVQINGQIVQVSMRFPSKEKFPSNVGIWAFRNTIKDSRMLSEDKTAYSESYPSGQRLLFNSMQENSSKVQNLLRLEKEIRSENLIDHQIMQWTDKYHQIFGQNEKYLQGLAQRIEKNIDKRKLEEQLKERQEEIVLLTQKELVWSQILLLFKKGHSDKTQQLLNDAMEIITIKEMNMNESHKKKKSTSQEKLKSLFETDCKICFSTQSDEKINKVFYCDGCNTSFHQICYGISKVEAEEILKLDKFYCDVCSFNIGTKPQLSSKRSIGSSIHLDSEGRSAEKSQTKQKKPCCQICCKSNFPMKLINGHFYHVTCLFMFDFAQVCDYKIKIKEGLTFEQISGRVIQNEISGSLCQFCLKYQGMKFKCLSRGCGRWYHPICAYLNGIYFNINRNFRCLEVKLYCYDHQPFIERNIINQIYIRRFFCDYKKTSNLNEEDFQEQYAREIKDLSKEKIKQLSTDIIALLIKKAKTIKTNIVTTGSTLGTVPGTVKRQGSQMIGNCNYDSSQNIRLQQSMAESSQQNELERERNQFFIQKMDHARFIEESLDFD